MENNQYKPMTVGNWIVTYLLMAIPIVGFILVLVWAFSGTNQPSKKSWAQATLIMMLISSVFVLLFMGFIANMLADMF